VAKIFIAELKPNQEVTSAFVAADKQLRVTRNGAAFVTLRLVDRTGEVVGRIWENADEWGKLIPVGGVVAVTGRCETYKGELQLNIRQIQPLERHEVDPADFLPVCGLDLGVLTQQLKRMVGSLKHPSLQRLMQAILDDRPLMDRFKRAPAAKSMHHAYLGGLLEHTVSVTTLASIMAKHYVELNRDLLVAGAILHDIGKTGEFIYDLAIDYSDSGRLLGHMILGLQIVEDKIRSIGDFPPEQAVVLKHLILSHHGEHEFGAVKLPMTREAFVLHLVDDMDAKMNALQRIIDQTGEAGATWSTYQPALQRFIYRGTPQPVDAGGAEDGTMDAGGRQLSLWSKDIAGKTAAASSNPAGEPSDSGTDSKEHIPF
jgi:3'-5' exoribonuclease